MRQAVTHFWHFASEAEWAALVGAALLLCAGATMLAERRRHGRSARAGPGWIPWTAAFLALTIAGMGLLALAVPALVQGR